MEKVLKFGIFKLVIFGAFLASCTSLKEDRKSISSGLVGCDPKTIVVSDSKDSTWKHRFPGKSNAVILTISKWNKIIK